MHYKREYKPKPVKRVQIPKPDGGKKSWSTNGNRPNDTTSNSSSIATDI